MKNIIKIISSIILFKLLIPTIIFGQSSNEKMNSILKINYGNGWLEFKKELNIQSSTIFDDYKTAFELAVDDDMNIIRIEEDNIGFTHYRFQQTYKGIKVEGAEYIVHEKDNKAVRGNGKIVNGLDLNVNPTISQSQAINIAMQAIPAEKYKWEDENAENFLKYIKDDENATYYPQPKLLITYFNPESGRFITESDFFKLAYKVNIHTAIPYDGQAVYVDAQTGEIIKTRTLIIQSNSVAACTTYDGNQDIYTSYDEYEQKYKLFDATRGNGIHTVKGTYYHSYNDIYSLNNTWTTNCHYTQTHWGGAMAYDYFFEKHDRNGWDNDNGVMLQIHDVSCYNNAYWYGEYYGNYTKYCQSSLNPSYGINSLDIIGHEWGHAVVQETANLDYFYESGGLNESFADIFGKMIEFYAKSLYDVSFNFGTLTDEDFYLGKDIPRYSPYPPGFRNMCNLELCNLNASDTYQGEGWYIYPGWGDIPSPHYYMGVQNKWFCLLSIGGNGINNHGYYYDVNSIGIEKAADIAYRNLTAYLTTTSDYPDARMGSILATKDLFGNCSPELIQVVRAWNAVGVYGPLELEENIEVCGTFIETQDPDIFEAINEILAGKVVDEQCQTIIEPGADVVFKAGNRIVLGHGFHAKAGSHFHAFIEPCIEVSYKSLFVNNSNSEYPKDKSISEISNVLEENKQQDLFIYPNPFKTFTIINYHLKENEFVNIAIYDTYGRKVKTLINNKYHPVGQFSINFERSNLESGIYFCIFRTNSKNISKKIIIL